MATTLRAPNPRAGWALAAALAVTTVIYAPALGGYFLGDDLSFLAFVAGRSDDGSLGRTLLEGFVAPPDRGANFYRPLLDVSFAIDYAIWGTRAWGWHLTNLVVHLANALLLAALVRALLAPTEARRSWAPEAAGALFALHPLGPESVAWISGRSDLFALLGGLGAVLLYLRASRWRSIAGATSLLAFVLGLASKEAAITVPAWIVALHLAGWRGGPRRALYGAGPFAVVAIGYLGLRLAIFGDALTVVPGAAPARWSDPDWLAVRWEAIQVLARSSAAPRWEGLVAALLTAALLVLGVLAARRSVTVRRLGLFAALWLGSTLVPLARYLWIAPDGEGARLFYVPWAALSTLLCVPLAARGESAGRSVALLARAAVVARVVLSVPLLWASVADWASAGEAMKRAVAGIRELGDQNDDPSQIYLLLPDSHGAALFARNGMGPLMEPPVQPRSYEPEVLIMTSITAPGHLEARLSWDPGLEKLGAYCWSERTSALERMEVPPGEVPDRAALRELAAEAGCLYIATEP